MFLPLLLHFWNYNYPLMDKWFLLLVLKHAPKHGPWGLNGTKYWRLFIAEYLQPNKFKERPDFGPIYQVSCFSLLGDASCFHVFPEKDRLSLHAQGKKIMFLGKKYHLSSSTRNDVPARPLLEIPSFQKACRKYHISVCFLRKIIFHFPPNV